MCVALSGRNFRSAEARQRVSDQRKEKAQEKRNVVSLDLKTVTKSLLRTVFSSEFQPAGAEHQKARLSNAVVVNG